MVKVWRNRIWAGTQKLASCPTKYKSDVIALMQEDIADGTHRLEELKVLVAEGKMYKKDYKTIAGMAYEEEE